MLKHLILTIILLSSIMLTAQEKQQNFIIKTNMLNYFIVPSIHVECRVAKKSSLVLNYHHGILILIGYSRWTNTSLEYRRYFSKKTDLTGFYLAPGVNYNYEHEVVKQNAQGSNMKQSVVSIGGIVRIGYQIHDVKNWVIDFGTGIVIDKEVEADYEDQVNAELRLMLGIGYKF